MWNFISTTCSVVFWSCLLLPPLAFGQRPSVAPLPDSKPPIDTSYTLGSGDQVTISVVGAEELDELADKSFQIDNDGYLNVPMVGRIRSAGLTPLQLQAAITTGLKKYVRQPQLYINVTKLKSQPVSVLGAVNTPGVHQLEGPKTLIEVLALAGGLTKDAGYQIRLTRENRWGPIPLPHVQADSTGRYTTAEVNARGLTEARSPEENIIIRPNDVITVPRSQLIYVIGEVRKAGGFTLGEQKTVSVLQALSLAEGLTASAYPRGAKILRQTSGAPTRTQIPIDLKNILRGKTGDVALNADDILFVPDNATKKAGIKVAEQAMQTISNLIIWRGL
jgi:polysaccharide biosynthesis/export protein